MCIALLDVRSMLGVGILVFISIYLNNNGGNMKTLVLNFSHIVTSGLLQYSDIFKWGKVSWNVSSYILIFYLFVVKCYNELGCAWQILILQISSNIVYTETLTIFIFIKYCFLQVL